MKEVRKSITQKNSIAFGIDFLKKVKYKTVFTNMNVNCIRITHIILPIAVKL